MEYENDEPDQSAKKGKRSRKQGRKDFTEDMADAVKKGTAHLAKKGKGKGKPKKGKGKGKQKQKGKGSRYDDMSAKELYSLVKGKRDMILAKAKLPARLPRGRTALIEICKKIKLK